MNSTRVTVLVFAALLAVSAAPQSSAQDADAPAAAHAAFSAAQLDQLAGPIALYPDALLSQILMASTYPLEIVEADRWLTKQKGLAGAALEDELRSRDWDISVKSLCTFPSVVRQMSENLDWTQDLGDAFLGQKSELLDAVQRLRAQADAAGNLKSNEQQTVTQADGDIFVIAPANPTVIYVPTYYPYAVYGVTYPALYYPAFYAPPPPRYTAFTFAAGVAVGAALWGDCHWSHGHSDVNVNVNQYNTYNSKTTVNASKTNITNVSGNKATAWTHSPEHRQGVNYRNPATAAAYGGGTSASRASAQAQAAARGYGGGSASRAPAPAQQPATRPATSQQPATRPATSSYGGERSNALSGSGDANFDRAASQRGAASRSGGGGGGRRR